MQNMDELKAGLAQLEKHIESQDMEVYRQRRLIEALQKQIKKLEERIDSIEQDGTQSGTPADERPPHY